MKRIIGLCLAVLISVAVLVAIVPYGSDADAEELYCTGVEYEEGIMKVDVNRNVAGEIFLVYIDGVLQTLVAYGQEGDWILISHEVSDDHESFVLKNDAYTDVTFTYPESSSSDGDRMDAMVYIIPVIIVILLVIVGAMKVRGKGDS